jgi:hypothetical protein
MGLAGEPGVCTFVYAQAVSCEAHDHAVDANEHGMEAPRERRFALCASPTPALDALPVPSITS